MMSDAPCLRLLNCWPHHPTGTGVSPQQLPLQNVSLCTLFHKHFLSVFQRAWLGIPRWIFIEGKPQLSPRETNKIIGLLCGHSQWWWDPTGSEGRLQRRNDLIQRQWKAKVPMLSFCTSVGFWSRPACRRGTLLWHLSILVSSDWTAQ